MREKRSWKKVAVISHSWKKQSQAIEMGKAGKTNLEARNKTVAIYLKLET